LKAKGLNARYLLPQMQCSSHIRETERVLLLRQALPEFSSELETLLLQSGRTSLAREVAQLWIVDRCRCGDDFCATFYTAPKPQGKYGPKHENIELSPENGMIILDLVDGVIQCVEVLYRDEVRSELQSIMP
jgi:hypothetical protein